MINTPHHSNQQRQIEGYILEKDAYLLCLHVKPTSLFCGFTILIMSFMNIVILLSKFQVEFNPDAKDDASSINLYLDPRLKTNKLIVLYIIAESLKLLISSLLIFGITRCKPSYLIPFFLMQLFYFFRSISFFLEHYANYQTYSQRPAFRNDEFENLDRKAHDIYMQQTYPIVNFFFALIYKLYFITCVFKCYKYLKTKESMLQMRQHQQPVNAAISVLHPQINPPSYNDCLNVTISKDEPEYNDQKLPSYDEACKNDAQDANKNINPLNQIIIDSNKSSHNA